MRHLPSWSTKSVNLSVSSGRGLFIGLAAYSNTLARAARAAPLVGRAMWLVPLSNGKSFAAKAISEAM